MTPAYKWPLSIFMASSALTACRALGVGASIVGEIRAGSAKVTLT